MEHPPRRAKTGETVAEIVLHGTAKAVFPSPPAVLPPGSGGRRLHATASGTTNCSGSHRTDSIALRVKHSIIVLSG